MHEGKVKMEMHYEDENVKIEPSICGGVDTYLNVPYKTPYLGRKTSGFLSYRHWSIDGETFVEKDGIGFRTGRTAKSIKEIVQVLKEYLKLNYGREKAHDSMDCVSNTL